MKIRLKVLLFLTALVALAGCGGSGDASSQVTGWAVGVMPDKTAPDTLIKTDEAARKRFVEFCREGKSDD